MAFKVWKHEAGKPEPIPDVYLDLREFGLAGSGDVALVARSKDGKELATLIVFPKGGLPWRASSNGDEILPGLQYTKNNKIEIT